MTRIAVLDADKCKVKKCDQLCLRFCPMVRSHVEAIRIEGKKGILPDESIIVKENFGPDKKLAAITVMYKEKGYDPAHNDWFWAKYQPDGTIDAEGKVKGCIDCHGLPKDIFKDKTNDYVWSSDLR